MLSRQILKMRVVPLILLRLLAIALLPAASLVTMPTPVVYAATTRTIQVDNVADNNPSGGCTLREAIDLANAGAGAGAAANGCTVSASGSGSPVTYVLNLPSYTYTLAVSGHEDGNADGDLDIEAAVSNDKTVVINGQGMGSTIIDGNNIERIFDIDPQRHGNLTVYISNLTLRNGREQGSLGGCLMAYGTLDIDTVSLSNVNIYGCRAKNGGAIYVDNSVVSVTNSIITENQAVDFSSSGSDGNGGAFQLWSGAIITVTNSLVSNNQAELDGGAFFNDSSTLVSKLYVVSSTIGYNQAARNGGAFYNSNGVTLDSELYISDSSVISGNQTVAGRGGAIYNENESTVQIFRSTLTGNQSNGGGGSIFNQDLGAGNSLKIGLSTISNNSVDGGWGGGLYNGFGNTAVITQTAIYSNSTNGGGGGGICNFGVVNVVNSTVSSNQANADGGGIYSEYTVNLSNVTVTDNVADSDNNGGDGGGIYQAGGTFTIKNTIIAGNTDTSGGAPDCGGSINAEGHNIIQENGGCTVGGTGTYSVAVDPKLGPWQDNGGSTYTHALLDGSPAIDTAPNCTDVSSNSLDTDQRGTGFSRPADGDNDGTAACDIGAFEVQIKRVYLPVVIK